MDAAVTRPTRPFRSLPGIFLPRIFLSAFVATSGLIAPATLPRPVASAAENENSSANAAIEKRMADAEQYLASEKLEGRGPGTHGIDLAADYIADGV